MTNDLFERLSRANPVPDELPAPPIEPVLERLGGAPRRSSAPRRVGAALAGVAGVAVTVAVVTIALGVGGHPKAGPSAGVPATARALVAELGVLRRPQTAADRDVPARLVSGFGAIPDLTRLARRAGSVRVFLMVRLLRSPLRGDTHRTALAQLVAVTPDGRSFGLGGVSASTLRSPRPIPLLPGAPVHAAIVPDGVSTLVETFRGGLQAFAHVDGNVAVVRFAHAAGPLLAVSWFDSHDRAIATYNAAEAQARQLSADERAIAASAKRPIALSLLDHFRVLGAPQSAIPGLAPPLPVSIAAEYARRGGGLNVTKARFVPVGETEPPVAGYRHGVWVIPGSHSLCYLDTEFVSVCAITLTGHGSPDSVGVVGGGGGNGIQWLTGVEPDGNTTVSIVLADRAVTKVRVFHNVFALAVRIAKHGRPVALIAKNAAGRTVRVTL